MFNTVRRDGGPDALSFELEGMWFAAQQIVRGARPILDVTGWLPTSKQDKGRSVCYYGRRTGQQCGKIAFTVPLVSEQIMCVRLKRDIRPGDSGGPVYTRPRGGKVKAVGVVETGPISTLNDLPSPLYEHEGCYTPIEKILETTFGAEFPIGSFEIPSRSPALAG